MDKAILVFHVLVSVSIIGLVLLQKSSTDGGAAFGGGSQQSLLGTAGSAPLLTKVTVIMLVLFFSTSMVLAYLNRHVDLDEVIIPAAETVQPASQQDVPSVTVNPVNDDLPAE